MTLTSLIRVVGLERLEEPEAVGAAAAPLVVGDSDGCKRACV